MLHEMMLPSIRLGALGALVPTRNMIHMFESELALDVTATRSAGRARAEYLIVLPNERT